VLQSLHRMVLRQLLEGWFMDAALASDHDRAAVYMACEHADDATRMKRLAWRFAGGGSG